MAADYKAPLRLYKYEFTNPWKSKKQTLYPCCQLIFVVLNHCTSRELISKYINEGRYFQCTALKLSFRTNEDVLKTWTTVVQSEFLQNCRNISNKNKLLSFFLLKILTCSFITSLNSGKIKILLFPSMWLWTRSTSQS